MSDPSRSLLFRQTTISQSLTIYLPAMVVYRLVGFARAPILAGLMSQADFGVFNVALLISTLLHPLCGLALNEGVSRYVPTYETRGMLRSFLARALPLATFVACCASLLLLWFAEPVGAVLFKTFGKDVDSSSLDCTLLMRVVACTTLVMILYFLLLSTFKGLRMFVAFSVVELVSNIGFAVAAITLAWKGWNSATVILWSYLAAMAVVVVVFVPLLWRHLPRSDKPSDLHVAKVTSQLVRFSTWLAMAAILGNSLQSFPLWYLHKIHGGEVAAVFAAVRHLAQAVWLLAAAVITVVMAGVTKVWEAEGREIATDRLLLATKTCGIVLIIGSAILAVTSPWLMHIYSEEYQYGLGIFDLSLLFSLMGGFLAFLSIHFHLVEKTRHILWPWAMGTSASVAVCWWFVRSSQAESEAIVAAAWAGVAAVTAALVTFAVLLVIDKRRTDRGVWFLVCASYALLLPTAAMVVTLVLVLLISLTTNWVFSTTEKESIRERIQWAKSAALRSKA